MGSFEIKGRKGFVAGCDGVSSTRGKRFSRVQQGDQGAAVSTDKGRTLGGSCRGFRCTIIAQGTQGSAQFSTEISVEKASDGGRVIGHRAALWPVMFRRPVEYSTMPNTMTGSNHLGRVETG